VPAALHCSVLLSSQEVCQSVGVRMGKLVVMLIACTCVLTAVRGLHRPLPAHPADMRGFNSRSPNCEAVPGLRTRLSYMWHPLGNPGIGFCRGWQ
jgi:hypothetical protein